MSDNLDDFMLLFPSDYSYIKANSYYMASVGSRTIEGGFTEKSDRDILVFYKPQFNILRDLLDLGYSLSNGSEHYDAANSDFNSFVKGPFNLIVSRCIGFAENFIYANTYCVENKIIDRNKRVDIFKEILYDYKIQHEEKYPLQTDIDCVIDSLLNKD